MVVPLVHLDLRVSHHSGRDFNLGDIDVQNYLSGSDHSHTLFYFVGADVSLPTGHYDTTQMINTGANFYTVTPNAGFTWMPSRAWEATGAIAAEFNTINPKSNYRSGSDVALDYAVTYRPLAGMPRFGVGIQGYLYEQLSDDRLNGVRVGPDGHRGQELGIGPQFRYDIGVGGLVLKAQHLFDVRNRPSGDRIWFEFATPIFTKRN